FEFENEQKTSVQMMSQMMSRMMSSSGSGAYKCRSELSETRARYLKLTLTLECLTNVTNLHQRHNAFAWCRRREKREREREREKRRKRREKREKRREETQ